MRHIIIAFAISIFSLNGFAGIKKWTSVDSNLVINSVDIYYYSGPYKNYKNQPGKSCNFQKIPSKELEKVFLDAANDSYLEVTSGNSSPITSFSGSENTYNYIRNRTNNLCVTYKGFGTVPSGSNVNASNNNATTNTAGGGSNTSGLVGAGGAIGTSVGTIVQNNQNKNATNVKTDSTICPTDGTVTPNCPSLGTTANTGVSIPKPALPEFDGEAPPTIATPAAASSGYGLNPQSSLDGNSTMFTNEVEGQKTVVTIDNDTGKTSTQKYNADGTPNGKPTKGIDPHWPESACKSGLVSADDCKKITEKSEAEMDPKAQAAADAKLEKNAGEYAELQQKVTSIQNNVETACSQLVSAAGMSICTETRKLLASITKSLGVAGAKQKICDGSSSKANFLCPLATSPAAQIAGVVMNGLAAAIPTMSSAGKTCQVTSKANLIGQGILGGGLLLCAATKFICEGSCAKTNLSLAKVETDIVAVNGLLGKIEAQAAIELSDDQIGLNMVNTNITTAHATAESAMSTTTPKQEINAKSIGDCKAYAVDMKQAATTMTSMGAAAVQAKDCENKVAALDASGGSGQGTSMTAMCAQPANASSIVCKCRLDNTAVGCPGHISANLGGGNLVKNLGGKGVSGMAGMSSGKPFGSSGLGDGLGGDLGLSDEAQKALSANSDSASDSGFSAAAGASAGGSGGGGASASAASAEKGKAEPKSLAGSFMSAIGSLFKGGSGAKPAGAKNDNIKSDKYNVKRQIANEQLRSEISGASGVDNWTKVKTRYKSNYSSLIAE